MEPPPATDPPPSNGDSKESNGATNGQNLSEKPPLGRHASAGDSQPQLGPRKESVGVVPLNVEPEATEVQVPSEDVTMEDVKEDAPEPAPAQAPRFGL